MTADALGLLGLARKAGKLEAGEEPVDAACRGHRAKLVLLAADAAENTARRAQRLCERTKVPWMQTPRTKAELGGQLGRASCAVLAFTDNGLAAAFAQKLAADEPARYGEAAQRLSAAAEETRRRQRELSRSRRGGPRPGGKTGGPRKKH